VRIRYGPAAVIGDELRRTPLFYKSGKARRRERSESRKTGTASDIQENFAVLLEETGSVPRMRSRSFINGEI